MDRALETPIRLGAEGASVEIRQTLRQKDKDDCMAGKLFFRADRILGSALFVLLELSLPYFMMAKIIYY